MKRLLPRRLNVVLLTAMFAIGSGLHVALLPTLIAGSPVVQTESHEHSELADNHEGCVEESLCSLCAFFTGTIAVAVTPTNGSIPKRSEMGYGPVSLVSRIADNIGYDSTFIRAPPRLFL